jgi:hypothetical protein
MSTELYPSYTFNMYVRDQFVYTFSTDCKEDFDEVVAYARAVKARGEAERAPVTYDMLRGITDSVIAQLRDGSWIVDRDCYVLVGQCDMTLIE